MANIHEMHYNNIKMIQAYLSFSSKGYHNGDIPEYLVDLHKLSAFYAKKHFGEVHLITDSYSKDFFKDISWTSVSTELDDVPTDYPEVWSLSKLYAYKEICKRGDPFIHIDNDAILWKPLPDRVINAEVFVQCPEDINKHGYEIDKFIEHCPYKQEFSSGPFIEYSYNLGIFGGKNLDFISQYADKALDFVLNKKNKFYWQKYKKYKNYWSKAVVAEQYFLAMMSAYYNQKVTCLFDKWPSEDEAESIGYSHVMGCKKDPNFQYKISHFSKSINFKNNFQ